MEEKICPIMAQGWIAGYMSNFYNETMNGKKAIEKLLKCLKEKCALWVEEGVNFSNVLKGYCGLMKLNEEK